MPDSSLDPHIPTGAPLPPELVDRYSAKERMVLTAAKLFQRQGYNATGLKQVVTEAHAPRGSIYHHFPGGKEELGVQAVEIAARELTRAIQKAGESAMSPAEMLRRLGRAIGGWLEGSDYLEGCPVSTVTLETAPISPSLTEACNAAYVQWTEMFAEHLVRGGMAQPAASRLATTIVAAVEGALLLCRARTSTTPLDDVIEELVQTVDSRLAEVG